ncbi:DUF5811 family protein [Haloarcula nitratireducens]|uniref:Uncharacterized protein n=1 Tax=Haloarcula nitratireducens TaxID=2487749 RepID=A0AAW4PEM8_9EURY|nr:DUF5811 family protein [Halomicroarcula nitratireducens]MBX0296359.1 hypothetical protein [Halomicroarcula nitratireducens]
MYGNTSFGGDTEKVTLTPEQRQTLREDLASVAARTRDLLPGEFVVGSEISDGEAGPRATIAVQPPVGSVVSAGYAPEDPESATITADERDDLAQGIAASAALQVKQVMGDDPTPTAQ